jgi:hypothetical protein
MTRPNETVEAFRSLRFQLDEALARIAELEQGLHEIIELAAAQTAQDVARKAHDLLLGHRD